MRWGRRRSFNRMPAKRHYHDGEKAICKKEFDSSLYTTTEIYSVTCKMCIKKMIKNGIAVADGFPSWLQPTEPVARTTKAADESGEFRIDDYKNDYLKRLGVF